MRWDDVQYFIEVAERGSVAAAARSLQVNHSTVLRHISSLERALGCRLFDRLPAGYVLTAQGREFAAGVADIPERLGNAVRQVAGVDQELRGLVRVTAPEPLGAALLVPAIHEFRQQHPQVTFEILLDNAALRLVQREADVALRGSHEVPDALIARRVGTAQTALYASREYVDRCVADGRPAGEFWVGPDDGLSELESARWLHANVPAHRVVTRVNRLPALVDVVAAGMGVGWLLCPVADARADLVRIRDPLPEFDTPLWVLTHPELRRVARVATFARFLADHLFARF